MLDILNSVSLPDIEEWIRKSDSQSVSSRMSWSTPEKISRLLKASLTSIIKAQAAYPQWRKDNPEAVEAILERLSNGYALWRFLHTDEANKISIRNLSNARPSYEYIDVIRATGPRSNNHSGFKGVSWSMPRHRSGRCHDGRWRSHIYLNGKLHSAGEFKLREHAALAYDRMTIQYHGGTAYLNFPLFSSLHYAWYTEWMGDRFKRSKSASGYKGVYRGWSMKWYSNVQRNGKNNVSGGFTKKEYAAVAYDRCAISLLPGMSYLNFPLFSSIHSAWYNEWNPQ